MPGPDIIGESALFASPVIRHTSKSSFKPPDAGQLERGPGLEKRPDAL